MESLKVNSCVLLYLFVDLAYKLSTSIPMKTICVSFYFSEIVPQGACSNASRVGRETAVQECS
uniref:Uncharacterized protein n=1 Tax=Anguilla anguilla TaxID=7936 RepID=A0A0E9X1T2_ANGAN